MGNRIHICSHRKMVVIYEDERFAGYTLSVRYSKDQRDWFNNQQSELANWLNDNCDEVFLDEDAPEWAIQKSELEGIPEEAYLEAMRAVSPEELRRFVAESIKCAQEDGMVYYEWF